MICPDLSSQTLRTLLGLLAAVHRAHVDCGEHPAWTATPFTTAGSRAVSSGNPGSVCPDFAGAGRMLLRGTHTGLQDGSAAQTGITWTLLGHARMADSNSPAMMVIVEQMLGPTAP